MLNVTAVVEEGVKQTFLENNFSLLKNIHSQTRLDPDWLECKLNIGSSFSAQKKKCTSCSESLEDLLSPFPGQLSPVSGKPQRVMDLSFLAGRRVKERETIRGS